MIRRSAIAAILVIAAASPRVAAADDASEDPVALARALVEQGQNYYDLGEYTQAIAVFREAYRLDPRHALLFNIGQAYRLAGDCVNASLMYRNFLRLAPESRHRPLAEQHLASLETCEREQLAANINKPQPLDTAEPAADGARPTPIEDEPEQEPEPTPIAAPPPTTPDGSRGANLRLAGVITAAAGGLSLVAGGYFALDAAGASQDVSDAYRDGGTWADVEDIDARGRRSEKLGAALLVTGGVAVAAGATLYVLGRRAGRSAVIVPREGGGEVVMTWAF